MRIFFDTNILIDLLEARGEFTQNALKVANRGIDNGDELLLSDLSVVNASYIQRKSLGSSDFVAAFSAIRECFEIVSIGASAIDSALAAGWKDFEDALQHFAASEIKVVTPVEYLADKTK